MIHGSLRLCALLALLAGCSFNSPGSLPPGDGDGDGDGDAAPPFNSDGGDCEWSFRRRLGINNTSGAAQTDAPILVRLDSSRIRYDETDGGVAIRFFDVDGAELDHEIESWDDAGDSLVWVRVPEVAAGADAIYLYYGNAEATDAQNPTGVWRADYRGVWHMSQSGDSSEHGNSPTNNGTSASAGAVGDGRMFDGASAHLDVGSDASLDDLEALTMMAWINPTAGGDREVVSKAGSTRELRLRENAPNTILRGCINYDATNACSDAQSGSIAMDTWQLVAMTYDGAGDETTRLYIDGTEVTYAVQDTGSGNRASDASSTKTIGRRSSGDRHFAGRIDEVRISAVARSAEWIALQHRSMTDALLDFGAEESCQP